jgi:hypothetical protein
LRCSISKGFEAFRRGQNEDGNYARMLAQTPVVDRHVDSTMEDVDSEESDQEQESRPRRTIFADDNLMRGNVFGDERMLRKKIYWW